VADLGADAFGADVLVLWESSRGSRKVGQWVELIDLCEDRGVRIAVTTHGRMYDAANARDRRSLLEDAVDSEYESAKISGRVRRSIRQNATARRPHGNVPFGYRRIHDGRTGALLGQEAHPEQAPIVQRVVSDYLGGRSARSIVAEFNDTGVHTNRGNGWTPLMVKRMLTKRSYLGHRLHNGEDFGQGWEPLIDADTFERVAARLEATAGRKFKRTSRLVSGLVRCGVCRSKMQIKDAGHYGCPGYHAYRRADQLDAFVTAGILERLSRADVSEALTGREDPRVVAARDCARELRAELEDAMSLWKAKRLSVQAYADMEADLLPRIESAEREARRAVIPLALDVPPGDQVPAWWDGLGHEVRREVVGALVAAVVVEPTGRGCRKIDWPATTAIEWRR
jgi:DNA invertase Pin-like site-specific DNA recombinase